MASLTIRNLSITPLELVAIERHEAGPGSGLPSGSYPVSNITRSFTNLFSNGTSSTRNARNTNGRTPTPDSKPIAREDIQDVRVEPFVTKQTNIRAADPAVEVLRLTFQADQTGGGQKSRYTLDVPAPSQRSLTLVREAGGGGEPKTEPEPEPEFTAVYMPAGAFLAIYSSASLDSWMGRLADGLPLSVLSIPGTHNSPTCHRALPSVRCQAVGVPEQLANGVRFLDIRVSVPEPVSALKAAADPPSLQLVHSAFPISLLGPRYLHDLLGDCYSFLDAHPSETLLVSLKREGTGNGKDQDLARVLATERYTRGGSGQAQARWFTEPRVPSLGEVRGRIMLLRRFGLPDEKPFRGKGFGIDASSWPDNCVDGVGGDGGSLRIQDFYEVTAADNIAKKIELCRAHLERAAEQVFGSAPVHVQAEGTLPAKMPLFINFLSGSNFFNPGCWPEKIAAKVNPSIIEYLCMRHGDDGKGPGGRPAGDCGTGIVITDWVGERDDWDLIRCIVGWNARLQLKSWHVG
jgi:1-phosphatidylinositol phosphodiesterase